MSLSTPIWLIMGFFYLPIIILSIQHYPDLNHHLSNGSNQNFIFDCKEDSESFTKVNQSLLASRLLGFTKETRFYKGEAALMWQPRRDNGGCDVVAEDDTLVTLAGGASPLVV